MEETDSFNHHPVIAAGEVLFDVFPETRHIGGAPFNFACQLHSLGFPVLFVSSVGNDAYGKEILDFMESVAMPTSGVNVIDQAPTGEVVVSVDSSGAPTYEIIKDRAWDQIKTNPQLSECLQNKVSMVCYGTLAQRSQVSRDTIRSIVEQAGKETIKVCDINLRQSFYNTETIQWCLKNADLVKLNDEELIGLGRLLGLNSQVPQELVKRFDLECLCVTYGEEGSKVFLADGATIGMNSNSEKEKIQVKDTVGAGDAYTAMLCAGVLSHLPWKEAMALATEFAAEICGIRGALPEQPDFYNSFRNKLERSCHG